MPSESRPIDRGHQISLQPSEQILEPLDLGAHIIAANDTGYGTQSICSRSDDLRGIEEIDPPNGD